MTEDHAELLRELLDAITGYRKAETKNWQERNTAQRNLVDVMGRCEQALNKEHNETQKPN